MASTSSLLKNAASIRDQLANYQDSVMAYQYSNSAYTDAAFSEYANYLKSRIGSLGSSASISSASKALTLTKALDSAGKSNISASIQRENIQVLSGNATLTDKYNVISSQFVRAQANGDMTLAQSLEGQAYSLSQSIQMQQQQASDASATLAKANATAQGDIASHLDSALHQLNTDMAASGHPNDIIKSWVNNNAATFKALGVAIPTTGQPNYFDIVNGVMGAMYNHYALAAQAVAGTDPYAAQTYKDKATALMNGETKVATLGGDMTAQEVQSAAANPAMMAYDQNTGKYVHTAQTGYAFNPNAPTVPQATYSGSINRSVILSTQQTTQINNLGLNFKPAVTNGKNAGAAGNGVEVQATDQTPQWLKSVLGQNGITNMYTQHNSATNSDNLVFQASSVSGQGKAIYTVTSGNQLWESSNLGDKLIGGAPAAQPQQPKSVFGTIGNAFMSGLKYVDTVLNAKAYADALPSNMLNQATNHYTLPPIPVAKPMQLPTLSVAAPQPQAPLTVKAAPTIQPATVNPQQAAPGTTVQGGSAGVSLQGGNMNLQGGGGHGISLQ